jgi:hypothetical protein
MAPFITNEHEINKTFIILKYFDPVRPSYPVNNPTEIVTF